MRTCHDSQNNLRSPDISTQNCRALLDSHAAAFATLAENPATIVSEAVKHCANLHAAEEPLQSIALSLHYFEAPFLWAPRAARTAVFGWAQDAFVIQFAASTQPFASLPDDCAGDVLEFLDVTMPRTEVFYILAHCISPEAYVWVRKTIAAAVVVSIIFSCNTWPPFTQQPELPEVVLLITASFSDYLKEEASRGLLHAVKTRDTATVQDCLAKGGVVEVTRSVRKLLNTQD